MVIYGNKAWYSYLKDFPKRIQTYDIPVRFKVVLRQIGERLSHSTVMIDEDVVACGIEDADTLLGILFYESLKSRCIAAIDESMGYDEVIYVTIVLVQGKENTNIDAEVLDSLAKVFNNRGKT